MTLSPTRPRRTPPAGTRREQLVGAVFYGGLLVLMVAVLTTLLDRLLPAGLENRISYNSEGYVLAIVLAGWIQFALPRLTTAARWPITLAAAASCLVLGMGLYTSELPSQFKTLNETFIALALLLPYLTLARALRRWWPPLASAAVLVLVVVGVAVSPEESPVVLLAETMAMLFLVPLAFDVVDRGILEPRAVTSAGLRYGWYTLLIVVPVTVVLLGTDARSSGGFAAVLEYLGRVHEAFIGVLLLQLYLAIGLGRTGSRPASKHRAGTGS